MSSRLSVSSSRISARSPASSSRRPPGTIERATCSASSRTASWWKIRFASLCGLRERRARVRAALTTSRSRRTCCCSTTRSTGRRGSCCRSRTAAAMTPTISARPLTSATSGRLEPPRVQPREELPDRAEHDAGLPQRRQHLPDVAQERRVGPHHEDAAAGQPVAVGVEQVGGAVQRDGGLAGARPALHHQHARRLRPDDLVLLGLDRGDDVGHPAGAARAHRGEQRGLAGEPAAPGDAGRAGGVEVEHLVVDGGDLATAGAQVPSPADALGRRGGRRVEGPGGGRAPVHQQRVRTRCPRRAGRAGRRSGSRRPRCRAGRTRARARRPAARRAGRCRCPRRRRAR